MNIDLAKYRGNSSTSFTGRSAGESARIDAGLDQLDKDQGRYTLQIPHDTSAFNPSFFLGFLYDSIKDLKMEEFELKYSFSSSDSAELPKHILDDIEEGKRHASNQLKSRGGLLNFIKF